MENLVKENFKLKKKNPGIKHPENLAQYERQKCKHNGNRERRETLVKGTETIFNKIIEENF